MDKILHGPTPTAEWQALVSEAKHRNAYALAEDLESYLVFLLMRFSGNPEITQSILATEFLESIQQLKMTRLIGLRNVGDKCLLLAGLFPGRARKRRVNISYFVRLGQMAYSALSVERHMELQKLYASLAEHFVLLMDILHCMQELNENKTAIDLLQAEELWRDTKSLHAFHTLRKSIGSFNTKPLLLFPNNHDPFTKH